MLEVRRCPHLKFSLNRDVPQHNVVLGFHTKSDLQNPDLKSMPVGALQCNAPTNWGYTDRIWYHSPFKCRFTEFAVG
jgi:hypothetical protein